jgi:uncharacterized protein YbaR (Trm112 family)
MLPEPHASEAPPSRERDEEEELSVSEEHEARLEPTPEITRIDPRLLEILVCPLTKTTLEYDAAHQELVSRSAKLAYPIRDGIPIMLPEEARRLE